MIGYVNALAMQQNPQLCGRCRSANPGVTTPNGLCYLCQVATAYDRGREDQNRALVQALEQKARRFRGRYSMVRSVCRQMASKLRGY